MKKLSLLALTATVALCLVAIPAHSIPPTCANHGIACGTSCAGSTEASHCPVTGFTGMCIGASNDAPNCVYNRCSGAADARLCVAGPFGASACRGDSDCSTGQVCVSDSGTEGCGTGFAQCMTVCPVTTTSTSTSTSSSTTSSTTSTSTSTSSTTSTSSSTTA